MLCLSIWQGAAQSLYCADADAIREFSIRILVAPTHPKSKLSTVVVCTARYKYAPGTHIRPKFVETAHLTKVLRHTHSAHKMKSPVLLATAAINCNFKIRTHSERNKF